MVGEQFYMGAIVSGVLATGIAWFCNCPIVAVGMALATVVVFVRYRTVPKT